MTYNGSCSPNPSSARRPAFNMCHGPFGGVKAGYQSSIRPRILPSKMFQHYDPLYCYNASMKHDILLRATSHFKHLTVQLCFNIIIHVWFQNLGWKRTHSGNIFRVLSGAPFSISECDFAAANFCTIQTDKQQHMCYIVLSSHQAHTYFRNECPIMTVAITSANANAKMLITITIANYHCFCITFTSTCKGELLCWLRQGWLNTV